MREALAYARFLSAPIWHGLVDINRLETACGFRFNEQRDDFEVQPHLGVSGELCGICDEEIATTTDTASATFFDGRWRPTDHA